jgi:hypothetical protein
VRWEGLFSDLEAQAEELERTERALEIGERARIEVGALGIVERLLPARGSIVRLRCQGDLRLAGALQQVGLEWALIDGGRGDETLVALDNVLSVVGLTRLSAAAPRGAGPAPVTLSLRQALRGLGSDRSVCQIRLVDASTLVGTIDRVGADFAEIAVHAPGEPRRRSEVLAMQLLAITAIVAVRRDGRS